MESSLDIRQRLKNLGSNTEAITICLLGYTGAGKSSFGNELLKK